MYYQFLHWKYCIYVMKNQQSWQPDLHLKRIWFCVEDIRVKGNLVQSALKSWKKVNQLESTRLCKLNKCLKQRFRCTLNISSCLECSAASLPWKHVNMVYSEVAHHPNLLHRLSWVFLAPFLLFDLATSFPSLTTVVWLGSTKSKKPSLQNSTELCLSGHPS